MLHPVGPLQPSVYWRRRVVLAAALLVVLILLRGLFTSGGDSPEQGRFATVAEKLREVRGEQPAPRQTITVPPGASGGPAAGNQPAGQTPSPSAQGTASASGGTGSGGANPGNGTPATCADSALRLAVATVKPEYTVGAQPVIRLTVTNTSDRPCTRDVGAAEQEVLVYSGKDRLWSSNDCYPGGSPDVRTLQPDTPVQFSVTWTGLSSQPECGGQRGRVPAGRYTLVGHIGSLNAPEATFTLKAP